MILKKLMVATGNAGKLAELRAALEPLGVTVTPPAPGIPAPEETGATFESNARIKALAYADAYGTPVLADDSGLEIDPLDGFPGVRSARYAEETGGYLQAFLDLERRLREAGYNPTGTPGRFVCALCLYFPASGETRIYHATCEGTMMFPAGGERGFGYDPVFVPQGYDRPFADLPHEIKARESHRAKALKAMAEDLGLITA